MNLYAAAKQPLVLISLGRGKSVKTKFSLLKYQPFYERARSARSFFFSLEEKYEYERPAGRPAVVTVLRGLYLSNHETD